MECELSKDGILIISSDTEIEEYALKQWQKRHNEGGHCDIEIKIME